jgi:hypothetical protein
MPGMEAREPERTETSSGLSMPPNTAPTASPIVRSAVSTSGLRSSGSLRPFA